MNAKGEGRRKGSVGFGIPSSSRLSSGLMDDESPPTANSEKDLGNEYFKKKDFRKAIECYSRSIALSPTSVAFANRAMAYLKTRRYKEAEDDCTEALDLDDRYIKAYSRRATARKELGKFKESMEDSEFALRLEPNNQELKKLYADTKALYEKEIVKELSGASKPLPLGPKGVQVIRHTDTNTNTNTGHDVVNHFPVNDSQNAETATVREANGKHHGAGKSDSTPLQEIAARAASRAMAAVSKNITAPKTAYDFEVSWVSLSNDSVQQARFLKSLSPDALPQIFKSALSARLLIDIVKSIATFIKDEPQHAVSILDNLTKVPRFDMVVMCFSSLDRADLRRLWDDIFTSQDIPAEQRDALCKLRSRFCP